ncbi:tetratricopeptide repeat protein [Citrifermentans bremense]|uniref:tetratricopeptide repeat protein n=1 Tax=Citrifermentans bremense TaxID=60035 RepID=UPI0004276FFE|nr:tetratricopeptide repeat protein [Citrifermentans bremense]
MKYRNAAPALIILTALSAVGAAAQDKACSSLEGMGLADLRKSKIVDEAHPAGTPQNDRFFSELAGDGNAAVTNNTGVDRATGNNIERNVAEALNCFSISARQSQLEAAYNLGVMYASGLGGKRDYAQAVPWFKEAADQGDSQSQYFLGNMYREGCGAPRNIAEALKWYRLAAEKWHIGAQEGIAQIYLAENGPPDSGQATKWHALAGLPPAEAAYQVALHCGKGPGNACRPIDIAVWLRIAANSGNIAAAYDLAQLYEQHAAKFATGSEAVKWYLVAAMHGHANSQLHVGLWYNSQGPSRDMVQAWVWLDFAARQGVEKAAEVRDALAREMTRREFYAAQRLRRDMEQVAGILPRESR